MPRSYEYALPRKVKLGALRAALVGQARRRHAGGRLAEGVRRREEDQGHRAMFKKLACQRHRRWSSTTSTRRVHA
jgi:ribosomal protein L4